MAICLIFTLAKGLRNTVFNKDFHDRELANALIDVLIDEETYDDVYACFIFGPELNLSENIICVFQDDREFKSIFGPIIDQPGLTGNPELAIRKIISPLSMGEINLENDPCWRPLFLAKFLRAKILEKGLDYYTKYLDDLVIYLQRKLPYQISDPEIIDGSQLRILQHLYYQELSACGKPGLISLGFAVQAYELIKKPENREAFLPLNFELYTLMARLNQGIGFAHSNQKEAAAQAFDEVIREFERMPRCLQSDELGLWRSLLYDQAVLSKAELQEDLQFSYHTIVTLQKLGRRKRENRLIKEALAFRDMGRQELSKKRITDLLHLSKESKETTIKDIFNEFNEWESSKSSIKSKARGLLFDFYLQYFKERYEENESDDKFLDSIEFFTDVFLECKDKDETTKSKTERTGYYQQVARFLEWLSGEYKHYVERIDKLSANHPQELSSRYKDRRYFFYKLLTELYSQLREFLLPDLDKSRFGVWLDDFDKYDYDRYVESMEKFYKNLTEGRITRYQDDEQYLLHKLNEYEEKRYFLFEFKELERQQRINGLKRENTSEICQNTVKCFAQNPDRSSAFDGILACYDPKRLGDNGEHQAREPIENPSKFGNFNGRFPQLIDVDYETIMQRENDRFLDYLAYRSRHPIYYPQEGKVGRSFHFMGLQRWNSQTPTLTLSQGGGYLLYEQDNRGKVTLGIVIDPGFDFVDNLFHMGFTLNDIDFLLLSHSHLDHIRDFEPIVSSLLDLKKRRKNSNKKIHTMMTWGVYYKLRHVITNRTLREFLADTYIIDIDKDIHPNRIPADFSFMRSSTNNGFESITPTPDDNVAKKCLQIFPTNSYHDDYSERSDSYGFRIDFFGDEGDLIFSFGYTGDTKWHDKIPGQYKRCDAVCIHLGALIESEKQEGRKFKNYNGEKCDRLVEKKQHPYLFGLLRYLKKIQEDGTENKLLLISEFGEELKGGIRIDFLKRLNQLFDTNGNVQQVPVCLPVDIGLDVILARQSLCKNDKRHGHWVKGPPYKVWCYGCDKFVDAEKIEFRHFEHGNNDEALFYFCSVCLKSKPENAMQNKMRLICEAGLPLEKADE